MREWLSGNEAIPRVKNAEWNRKVTSLGEKEREKENGELIQLNWYVVEAELFSN